MVHWVMGKQQTPLPVQSSMNKVRVTLTMLKNLSLTFKDRENCRANFDKICEGAPAWIEVSHPPKIFKNRKLESFFLTVNGNVPKPVLFQVVEIFRKIHQDTDFLKMDSASEAAEQKACSYIKKLLKIEMPVYIPLAGGDRGTPFVDIGEPFSDSGKTAVPTKRESEDVYGEILDDGVGMEGLE